MAEPKYDKNGRLLFTKEMKEEYTVLVPDMLPIHFNIMRNIFVNEGYKVALLDNAGEHVKQLGLKYTHNDICYPALLVTGQFLDALTSGEYDPHKVALIIMQTGGGCRASNYSHIIRKALHLSLIHIWRQENRHCGQHFLCRGQSDHRRSGPGAAHEGQHPLSRRAADLYAPAAQVL